MRSLYLRIYLTVVAALALFALVSGLVWQQHVEQERERSSNGAQERAAAWGELLQRSLPGGEAPHEDQARALQEWSQRLRLPMALDDANGQRIGASESFTRREAEGSSRRISTIRLDDGRTLWLMRPGPRPRLDGSGGPGGPGGPGARREPPGDGPDGRPGSDWWRSPPLLRAMWPEGRGLVLLLVVLFLAVAAGAWPVVRRLTRRLEALKQGVEALGDGQLQRRVDEQGSDEVAALAVSFNRAAARIEALLATHKTLLANSSHELRSPLARLKMAVSLLEDAPAAQHARLHQEIHTNIAELDALVEEVLMLSRLDAVGRVERKESVELLALAAEEAARFEAQAQGTTVTVLGDERLLRRLVRNLLENAQRYGGGEFSTEVTKPGDQGQQAVISVCDRGGGVPPELRERIFEPFFRLPGHAEREGGVGLGLALVRQIAQQHGGQVRCQPREGGGSCFVVTLPA